MRPFEHRVVNGLLKASIGDSPEDAERVLACDWEIQVPPDRATLADLWPAVWALANVLQRQFSGKIYLNCGLLEALPGPEILGERCRFISKSVHGALRIGLGCRPDGAICYGDARGASLSVGGLIGGSESASPYTCFAVAGYLGFSALAIRAGIPPYREPYALRSYALRLPPGDWLKFPKDGATLVGLGHLGSAYLALLFFLSLAYAFRPRVHLIDADVYRVENFATQMLLSERGHWTDVPKAEYLKSLLMKHGWDISQERRKIEWGWTRDTHHPSLLILGLHDFEARRIALEGGYEWVFDAGLNSSFTQPRVSWNSLPPSREVGKALFGTIHPPKMDGGTGKLRAHLAAAPAACGWLEAFDTISASAPCMGLVASALVWSEVANYAAGDRTYCEGSLSVWSPILPPFEIRRLY